MTAYREAPRYEAKIVRAFWRINEKVRPNDIEKTEATLTQLLNDGWQICAQSEHATETAGWTTYTLTRLR